MLAWLERGADLHMAKLMPLPLTVSCFSKIQIGFAFLVPAHPGSPGERDVKQVCVYVCIRLFLIRVFIGAPCCFNCKTARTVLWLVHILVVS